MKGSSMMTGAQAIEAVIKGQSIECDEASYRARVRTALWHLAATCLQWQDVEMGQRVLDQIAALDRQFGIEEDRHSWGRLIGGRIAAKP